MAIQQINARKTPSLKLRRRTRRSNGQNADTALKGITCFLVLLFVLFLSNYYYLYPDPTSATSAIVGNGHTFSYVPASTEAYLMANLDALGWNVNSAEVSGCTIWQHEDVTNKAMFHSLHDFRKQLRLYTQAVKNFKAIPDLMLSIRKEINQEGSTDNLNRICQQTKIHANGIQSFFPNAKQQLSHTTSGYVEPLLTPMRHPDFCIEPITDELLMSIDYLIHDFEQMCLKLKPTSRLILIDMGASFTYEINGGKAMIDLIEQYKKFGFHFDHIYGFEAKFTKPQEVYNDLLPDDLMTSYHWINTGEFDFVIVSNYLCMCVHVACMHVYIYIYICVCVCVCVCANF